MATISVAGLAQGHLNARAAVGLAAVLMDLDSLLEQARIFLGARAGPGLAVEPVIIATGGYFQGFAEPANGVLGFHRVNPLKELIGGSERMPKVFLKYPAVGADSRSRVAAWCFRFPIVRRCASRRRPLPPWGRRREALPPGPEPLGMNP